MDPPGYDAHHCQCRGVYVPITLFHHKHSVVSPAGKFTIRNTHPAMVLSRFRQVHEIVLALPAGYHREFVALAIFFVYVFAQHNRSVASDL